jgi:hypothetical protein
MSSGQCVNEMKGNFIFAQPPSSMQHEQFSNSGRAEDFFGGGIYFGTLSPLLFFGMPLASGHYHFYDNID